MQSTKIPNNSNPSNDSKPSKEQTTESNNQNQTCHKCSSQIIKKQCIYVKCSIREKGVSECADCCDLSFCRHCHMSLCKDCRSKLNVLSCNYCKSFICSLQCYNKLIEKYFQILQKDAISVRAHESMHLFRKLLLPPYLHNSLQNISEDSLPFHVCESCKIQNCGCTDWIACINCRKYYCSDCKNSEMQKCALDECECRTCCFKDEWDKRCMYCNQLEDCKLIFCTKGHCNRHIIRNHDITDTQDSKNEDNDIEHVGKHGDTEDVQKNTNNDVLDLHPKNNIEIN